MIQNDQQSYLLVVDHNGEEQEVYQALADAALPYRNEKFIDFANMQSELEKTAIHNCAPFYHTLFYKKPQLQEAFKAIVEEIFSLKSGEVILVCDVVSGSIDKGREIRDHDAQTDTPFVCTIQAIEQSSGSVEAASSTAKGAYGSHFAFLIPYHTPDEFHIGGVLTR